MGALPGRYTIGDRIKNFPTERSHKFLQRLVLAPSLQIGVAVKSAAQGEVDISDSVRLTFSDGDIVHLRASSDAPGLRYYSEVTH